MAFEWPRFDVYEENIERNIRSEVEDQALHHYGVESVGDLTAEQMNEIEDFANQINPHSIMHIGFGELVNTWEDERDE